MNIKKIGKVLTSKSVGPGPSSYGKRIYRTAASQRLRKTGLEDADGALVDFKVARIRNQVVCTMRQISAII